MTKTITIIGLCVGFGCTPPINPSGASNGPSELDGNDTGAEDTGLPCMDPVRVFFDADGDGFGDDELATEACDLPAGHVREGGDCDDLDESIFPGAEERCDGLDQDCDGEVDEDAEARTWFEDLDGDGFGHPELQTLSCSAPEGYVDNGEDCDDTDSEVHPGAPERLNQVDTDCSGVIDDLTTDDADRRLNGEAPTDGFGFALAGGYDLDDAGSTDLVVGSYGGSEVRLYGGEGLTSGSGPLLTLYGAHEEDQFGRAVSLLQDINGDGLVDLVVGAPAATTEMSGAATVSLFLGPLDVLEDGAEPSYTVLPVPGEDAGHVVADVGSVYEGLSLFGVQATVKSTGFLGVHLYRVTERAGLESILEISGSGEMDRFGEAIGSQFDANGDGLADLVIGAPGAGGDATPGVVYIYLSPIETVTSAEEADVKIYGDEPNAEFGAALRTASDIDGDGIQNLVVGSPGVAGEAGEVRILDSTAMEGDLSAEALTWATLSGAAGRLGHAVDAPGDVDGDGHADVIAGAPNADVAGAGAGAAYIYWGGSGTGTFAPDASIEATASMVAAGTSLGSTASRSSGAIQSLVVGGYGADTGDGGDPDDETGALWILGLTD